MNVWFSHTFDILFCVYSDVSRWSWIKSEPGMSKRPVLDGWYPEWSQVAILPKPWPCTALKAPAQCARCPVFLTGQRSRQGRWPECGWTHRSRADHRRHESRPSPRRSRSTCLDTWGNYRSGCTHSWTWLNQEETKETDRRTASWTEISTQASLRQRVILRLAS